MEKKEGFLRRMWERVVEMGYTLKKIGKDDPRRVIHSFKMGLALTLVSSLYCFRPLYDGFGVSGMWAVLTVVVVFEFTVGATISRCLNRGFATLMAGALGIGVKHFASLFGDKGEPVVLGASVFCLAAAATFTRFIPGVKARYDYGMLIFILTFSLVAVSGFRVDEIINLACQRIFTILMGGAICLIVSICVCPVWAGHDLHNLMANNIEKLAGFLEGFGEEYFAVFDDEAGDIVSKETKKSFLKIHKSILTSKNNEDSLANFLRWEPYFHGQVRVSHPWRQYRKVGALARQCAYQFEALSGYVNSEIKISLEFRRKIQESCKKMTTDSSKALKELSSSLKSWTQPNGEFDTHIENSKQAIKEVENVLKSLPLTFHEEQGQILAMVSDATVVSILISVSECVEELGEAVHELAKTANFKEVEPTVSPEIVKPPTAHLLHRGMVNPVFEHERCSMSAEVNNASVNTLQDHVIIVA